MYQLRKEVEMRKKDLAKVLVDNNELLNTIKRKFERIGMLGQDGIIDLQIKKNSNAILELIKGEIE